MLLLILINVQYLQNVVFSFERGSYSQNHSLSNSHYFMKKFPKQNFPFPPLGGFPPYSLKLLENTDNGGIYTSLQNLKCPC